MYIEHKLIEIDCCDAAVAASVNKNRTDRRKLYTNMQTINGFFFLQTLQRWHCFSSLSSYGTYIVYLCIIAILKTRSRHQSHSDIDAGPFFRHHKWQPHNSNNMCYMLRSQSIWCVDAGHLSEYMHGQDWLTIFGGWKKETLQQRQESSTEWILSAFSASYLIDLYGHISDLSTNTASRISQCGCNILCCWPGLVVTAMCHQSIA